MSLVDLKSKLQQFKDDASTVNDMKKDVSDIKQVVSYIKGSHCDLMNNIKSVDDMHKQNYDKLSQDVKNMDIKTDLKNDNLKEGMKKDMDILKSDLCDVVKKNLEEFASVMVDFQKELLNMKSKNQQPEPDDVDIHADNVVQATNEQPPVQSSQPTIVVVKNQMSAPLPQAQAQLLMRQSLPTARILDARPKVVRSTSVPPSK